MDNDGKKYDVISQDFATLRDTYTEKKYLDYLLQRLLPSAQILDVGCGSGQPIASYLIKHHYPVTGIDASEKLLAIAKEKFPSLVCIYGDMRSVTLDEKYDAVIAWDSLFHLPKADQKQMLERFSHWVKPNGLLLLTTGDADGEILNANMLGEKFSYYSFSPAAYSAMLEEAGFNILLQEHDQGEEQHLVWVANLRA